MNFFSDLLAFFFPRQCDVCGRLLSDEEKIMCLFCLLGLPRTKFHVALENPVSQIFWGRVEIAHATAWFYFTKGGLYQKLIHKLKYKERKDIGQELGSLCAEELKKSAFACCDLILPVPLHPYRLRKRGYNQSECIAQGLSKVFGIPVLTGNLTRSGTTESQTRKNRFDRFLNMEGKFQVNGPEEIMDKKVLLVDDVITTGATLEACAIVLLEAGCEEVNILTLAVA